MDISLDLLSVSVLSSVRPLDVIEVRGVHYELSLNNINYYMPLTSNT